MRRDSPLTVRLRQLASLQLIRWYQRRAGFRLEPHSPFDSGVRFPARQRWLGTALSRFSRNLSSSRANLPYPGVRRSPDACWRPKPQAGLHDPGYLRIALVTLEVDGKPVGIETSSIFAKGGSHQKRNPAMPGGGSAAGAMVGSPAAGTGTAYTTAKQEVGFDTERVLTFRLAQVVDLH